MFHKNLLLFPIVGLFLAFPLFANPLFAPVFTIPKVWFLWTSGSLILIALNFYEVDKKALKLVTPFFIYLIMAVLSLWMSGSRATSFFGEYARWDGFLTIFLSAILFAAPIIGYSRKNVDTYLRAFLGSAILVSLLAVYERFFQNPFIMLTKTYDPAGHGALNTMDMSRSVASFGSPLYLAAFLIMAVPISIYFLSMEKRSDKILGKIALFMTAYALILTYSRGAWVGILIALALLIIVNRKDLNKVKKPALILLAAVIAFGFAFNHLKPGEISVSQRFASIFKAEAGARPGIWDSTLKMIEARPLLGQGPDNFKNGFIRFKQKNWNTNIRQPVPDKAHNEIFQQAATVGILGLTAFIWLIVYVLLRLKNYKGDNKLLAACISASLIAYFIQSLFNFFQISSSPVFWLLAGTGIAVSVGREGQLISLDKNKAVYLKLGFSTLVCAPILIFANFLWAADYNFQQSLAAGSDSAKKISYLNNATFLFRYEERYFMNTGKTLAKLYKEQKTPYMLTASERAFDKALALNPESVETLLAKADLYSAAWLENFNPQIDNSSDLRPWAQKAHKDYDAILAIDPELIDAYLGKGTIKAYENKFEEAIYNWEKALAIDSGSANAYFNIGWAYEKLGNDQRALSAYQKAIDIAPDMTEAREAKTRLTNVNN